jgi:two-component system response regulator CpxR
MDNVLVIDDDVELCDLVSEFLEPEGLHVSAVHDGNTGLQAALSGQYALVVLDIMIPEMNGLDVLREIRAQSSIPVLLLTARGSEPDRVIGLELGSDDYIPKPCSPRELLARIRAILRRTSPEVRFAPMLRVGDVELDVMRRSVTRDGAPVALTAIEFNILELLMRSAGMVVTREKLVQSILGRNFDPYDRSPDVHISKIRKKLITTPEASDPIQTLRGVGYIYTMPESSAQ